MENASKALLMAAGVLFGIVLLTLFVYIFTSYSSTTQSIKTEIAAGQTKDFNNKFLAYDSSKSDTIQSYSTMYDINTVVNMAKDNNEKYGLTQQTDTNSYISVYVDNVSVEQTDFKITRQNLNNNEYMYNTIDPDLQETNKTVSELTKYKCSVQLNPNTGLVYKIYFTRINT